ncbi:MAG: polysaccharide deacetylase family protein [Candidatus Dormiibacterota bacterium]
MRVTGVRGAATVLVIAITAFLLQAGAQPAPQPAPSQNPSARWVPIAAVNGWLSDSAVHEYFVTHTQVVQVGLSNIQLPILMYHYIRVPPSIRTDQLGYNLSVSPDVFSAQMDWLYSHDYHPVDFNDVRVYFAGTQPMPARPVVITLDDGYADLYTAAYPILAVHGFKAVAYIVSSFVGQARYVTASEVVQMDRNGIEIASHTVDHANLARSSSANVMHQLVESKRWLEQLLGHPVLDFAYPSGQFNAQVVAEVRAAGYSTAVTTLTSVDHSMADRYTWARVRVGGGESMSDFVLNLGPAMPSTTITTVDVETPEEPPPVLVRSGLDFK